MMSACNKMFALLLVILFTGGVWAQDRDQSLQQGEQVYVVTCATGYCHTLNGGVGGGAPRLAARGFDLDYITQTVSNGLPDTRMEGFANRLSTDELQAVITYVASLNGIRTTAAVMTPVAGQAKPELSAAAKEGKALLHDSLRAFQRCGACHQVEGSGVPVAEPLTVIPATARALRSLKTPKVSTVTLAGDSMPALLLRQGARRTIFYDLTSSPPVRRNVDTASVKIKAGSRWRHSSVIKTYSNAELEKILAYLREVTH